MSELSMENNEDTTILGGNYSSKMIDLALIILSRLDKYTELDNDMLSRFGLGAQMCQTYMSKEQKVVLFLLLNNFYNRNQEVIRDYNFLNYEMVDEFFREHPEKRSEINRKYFSGHASETNNLEDLQVGEVDLKTFVNNLPFGVKFYELRETNLLDFFSCRATRRAEKFTNVLAKFIFFVGLIVLIRNECLNSKIPFPKFDSFLDKAFYYIDKSGEAGFKSFDDGIKFYFIVSAFLASIYYMEKTARIGNPFKEEAAYESLMPYELICKNNYRNGKVFQNCLSKAGSWLKNLCCDCNKKADDYNTNQAPLDSQLDSAPLLSSNERI